MMFGHVSTNTCPKKVFIGFVASKFETTTVSFNKNGLGCKQSCDIVDIEMLRIEHLAGYRTSKYFNTLTFKHLLELVNVQNDEIMFSVPDPKTR